ncbi:MAG: serine hydrolase [Firmicutes bacterium]|nr:serine hydrolase [Bacillota bacterium]
MDRKIIFETCNDFLDEIMNLNDLPGLAIGVSIGGTSLGQTKTAAAKEITDGPLEFLGVRGYRDYMTRTPLEADDIFHCASVSKLFTSSAIMLLVEAGVLHLEDRLCDILPDFHIADKRYEDIKLWNMLTHTSGLGDVDDYRWYDCETDEDSLRRYVYESEEVINQPMLWEPQAQPMLQLQPEQQTLSAADAESPTQNRFRYSNIVYEILGQIVSEYSDRMPGGNSRLSYEDFIAEYLLKPAGMTNSTMKTFERPGFADFAAEDCPFPACMASPHEKKSDRSIGPVKYYPYTRQHAPSSTLTSNLRDLLRWGNAHLASSRSGDTSCGGPLLKPETYQAIWKQYAVVPNNGEQMGLGWFMRKQTVSAGDGIQHTYQLLGHEGTDDGFRASFWICPELDLVTVVLSNLSGAPVKKINKRLFDTLVSGIL